MVDDELAPGRPSSTAASTTTSSCARNCRAAGYRFFSTSDTEVIAKAYHRWGAECVDHFFGMFAFAILERDSGRLILGRDRLGIKPLYLTQTARSAAVRLLAAGPAGRR